MREIKFRGKTKEGKWIYGDLFHGMDGDMYIHIVDDYGQNVEVLTNTIGQYTGLKDANRKEIYEGDILDLYIPKNNVGKPEHRKRKVMWKGSGFQITNMHDDCIMDRVTSTIKLIYTVIGNIHDNPELIEK